MTVDYVHLFFLHFLYVVLLIQITYGSLGTVSNAPFIFEFFATPIFQFPPIDSILSPALVNENAVAVLF